MKRFLILLMLLHSVVWARDVAVVSYNIRYKGSQDKGDRHWDKRKANVLNYLKQSKAEIFGVQEALWPQISDLKKQFPAHDFIAHGRDDGKQQGESCGIFYLKDQWKADPTQQGTFWLSDTPNKVASTSWGNGITRICTWVRLVDKNGVGLYVYNTHWDHRSMKSHSEAAKLIIKMIEVRHYIDEPVIVMGDFNTTLDSPALKHLISAKGLRKEQLLQTRGGKHKSTTRWGTELKAGKPIDHCFLSPSLASTRTEIQTTGNIASDHHPVRVVIHWDSKSVKQAMEKRYLREVVLGKEIGGGVGSVIRWAAPVSVRAIGGSAKEKAMLKSVVDEINTALGDCGMLYIWSDKPQPNEVRVYLTDSKNFTALAKKEDVTAPENCDGFASLKWTTATKVIQEGIVMIGLDKSQGNFRRHVMLEEMTQSLGILGDTTVYPESVTFARGNDHGKAPAVGEIDARALRLIYRHLSAGDDALDVGIAYAKYWDE